MTVEPSEIGQKEKIQILLAEYASLRSEINARISSSYTVTGIGTALVIFVIQQPLGPAFWIGLFMIVVGVMYCGRLLGYDATNAARRVRQIELDINNRVGERLLVWETERGGLNASYWRAALLFKRT
jgi:hypothetical protein